MVQVEKIGGFTGHRDCIYALSVAVEDNEFYSAAGDGMVVSWRFDAPDQGELLVKLPNSVYALAYNADRKCLWVGQNFQGIHAIDCITRKETHSAAITTSSIFSIVYHENKLYCGCGDGTIVVLNAQNLASIARWKYSDSSVRTIVISPGGDELAVGYSDHCIRIFSVAEGTVKQEIKAHDNSVFALSYSPNGQFLLSGSRDARLKVWNVKAGYALQQSIVAHLYAINDIAFSPDGRYFVTCSMDKSIKVWDAQLFKLLKVIDKARHAGHGTSINKVLWTSFNNYLVSCSDDRTLSVWDLNFTKS
jgi:WD40 repeat protein